MIINKHEHLPRAGDSENKAHPYAFYLAPLPLPTGIRPHYSQNLLLKPDNTYVDLIPGNGPSEFFIRTAMATTFGITLVFFLVGLFLGVYSYLHFGAPIYEELYIIFLSHWIVPSLLSGIALIYAAPMIEDLFAKARIYPMRFNHQRREVAYIAHHGQPPLIVPWESVIACISSDTEITKNDDQQDADLMIGLPAPDKNDVVWLTLPCYTVAGALSEWEAIRVYMEEGHIPDPLYFGLSRLEIEEGTVEHFQLCRRVYREHNGYLMYLFGFIGLQALGGWTLPCHLSTWVKHLPSTRFPKSIKEWSKPLPPDQWQQPSAELIEQSQAVQKTLRKGLTLIDHFTALSRAPTVPKPGSLTERRKRRREARLQSEQH